MVNPFESVGLILVAFPAVVFVLVLVLRKVLLWLDERGYIFYSGNPSTYGSLGTSFLELQKMVQPQYEHILEVKDEEESHIEEDGDAGQK